MTVSVAFVQAGGYAASLHRRSRAAVLVKGAAATSARTGFLPFTGAELLPVAAGTPNMTTITPAGAVVIADSAGGAYIFTSDASTTLTHAAANGTNARIDLVIARVYDNEAGDAASTTSLTLPGSAGSTLVQTVTGAVEIVQGTPSASPAVPALPSTRCVILRQVTVRAATTSILNSDLANTGRPGWTVGAGGVLPVGTTAELAALTQYEGMYADDGQANQLVRSDGTSFTTAADPAVFTAWTAYTPTLTASTTSPTLGPSTLTGRYKQIGKTVFYEIRLAIVTGYAVGTGFYILSLPVAANATSYPVEQAIGAGSVLQSAARRQIIATVWTATSFIMSRCSTEAIIDSTGAGAAWGNGNILTINGCYEAA